MTGVFTLLDYAVILLYLIATIAVGIWFTRGQKSTSDYFLAGRSIAFLPAAISILATDLSAISYMGVPAWVFEKDLQYPLGIILMPLGMILVGIVFVPLFYRLRIFTVYEYLGMRYDNKLRLFASTMFVLTRAGWLATAIYTPSLAVAEITGIPAWECIVGMGLVATFYTVLGGMKAVIWTDFLQFFVLLGAAVGMAVLLGLSFDGGVSEMWSIAALGNHTRMFNFSLDPTIEVTVAALFFGQMFRYTTEYGADQIIAQRYFAAKSLRESIKSVLFYGILVVPVVLLLAYVGVGLAAYYGTHPDLAATLTEPKRVMPHFIAHGLPAGLSGLVIAGILAATMSTISGGIQSVATATMIDFLRPSVQDRELLMARSVMVFWGIVATLAGFYVHRLGTFLEIIGKIWSLFSGPLGGLFLLGVLIPRSNAAGALTGALVGAAVTWGLASCTPISWLWWGVTGGAVTMIVGVLVSLVTAPPRPEQRRLTLLEYSRE
ncbi:MAG TPA: sodium/solute symporter [bacterium]|nr:sodium/solute symporter [bacterium]HQL61914.1 sodium/solute symporter [bacterium]